MNHFADIFIWLQKRGKTTDEKGMNRKACIPLRYGPDGVIEKKELDEKLNPWTHRHSPGRLHAISEEDGFSVK